MVEKQRAKQAGEFAKRWENRGYERGESQAFWIDLLQNVFGVNNPTYGFIRFEEHQLIDRSNFIDCRIPSTRVIIEQKSLGKDLRKPIKQSDGSLLTPFEQARRYIVSMPLSEHPRWIVACNFSEFLVYDTEHPEREPEQILLKNLQKDYYRLSFLVDSKSETIAKELEVSIKAGEIIGKIYDSLLTQYGENSTSTLRWLNILCVRLVFCFYAEDAGIFNHNQFHDYLASYKAADMRDALMKLFAVLNTPKDKRSPYLSASLQAFPYTNGGIFEEEIDIPQITESIRYNLLVNASLGFDWSEISPTIFGSLFESTLNPETRRSGGMHYTSIENIHKLIDPLFLNDLTDELHNILQEKNDKKRNRRLDEYHDKLSKLTFFDPACGSGNFLTETYICLRRLENEILRNRYRHTRIHASLLNPIKVSINQFYGIEINDFAVAVATTALWISEAQMLSETESIIHQDIDFLPLKSYTNIRKGNALRMDWTVGAHAARMQDVGVHAARMQESAGEPPTLRQEAEWHTRGYLPHREYKSLQFVTYRLHDSVPSQIIQLWKDELEISETTDANAPEVQELRRRIDKYEDAGYGSCYLKDSRIANIVKDNLLHFDGERYRLLAWCIMPNHVHVLIDVMKGYTLSTIMHGWRSYTAHEANKLLGRSGDFWQKEYFDRYIRNEEHLARVMEYIVNNPIKAGLDSWPHVGAIVGAHAARMQESAGESPAFPDYIIGNPPFVGARMMSKEQKDDVLSIFGAKWKNVGNLDYVCCWYKKAADLMRDHAASCRAAFVSTNSICQGEQVANLWQPLFDDGIRINFAYRTFRWDSEASLKAHVHCVIVGFSVGAHAARVPYNAGEPPALRHIYDNDRMIEASNINAYLLDAPNVFVGSRQKPLCDVPPLLTGSQRIDNDLFMFSDDEKKSFCLSEPNAAKYFHRWYGAVEFINRRPRWVLYLGKCSPSELKSMPRCMEIIKQVRTYRLSSKRTQTLKAADYPNRFGLEVIPDSNFMIIPVVSSERRRYVPMGFMTPDIMCSNQVNLIPNASLYHFGVLTSNVHMAWMRAVCGRLKSDYRYSKDIVYNNFPWPAGAHAARVQKEESDSAAAKHASRVRSQIERTAQAILDARALYPDASLADLYDELTMPAELRRAHQENDCAVMAAYGFDDTATENEIVAHLFKLYNKLTNK